MCKLMLLLVASTALIAVGAEKIETRRFVLADESRACVHYYDTSDPSRCFSIPAAKPVWDLKPMGGKRYRTVGSGGFQIFDLEQRKVVDTFRHPLLKGVSAICDLPDGGFVASVNCGRYPGHSTDFVRFNAQREPVVTYHTDKVFNVRTVNWDRDGKTLLVSWNHGQARMRLNDQNKTLDLVADYRQSKGMNAFDYLPARDGTNYVCSCGFHGDVLRLSPEGKVLWRAAMPQNDPKRKERFYAQVQEMPDGSLYVAHWTGHGSKDSSTGWQVVQLAPDGSLRWGLYDPARLGSCSGLIVLDAPELKEELVGAVSAETLVPRMKVPIRDPFVVVEKDDYLLYHARRFADGRVGVAVRQSKDLEMWTPAKPVLVLPPEIKHTAVWAPEVHRYAGAWWIFATLTFAPNPTAAAGVDLPQPVAMRQSGFKGGELRPRGVWIFKSDSPLGPFKPVKKGPVTPREWMCLDGTLWVEDGVPWMVFCHEWCQTGNGRMMAAPMSKDLTHFMAKPIELFRAADVPQASHVTDGPFLLRPAGLDGLRLIWSNFLKGSGYCVLQAKSVSGKVAGPWQQLPPIYRKDGGHGMCFTRLDGQLMLVLHQPNHGGLERLHLFPLKAEDDRLVAQEEAVSKE